MRPSTITHQRINQYSKCSFAIVAPSKWTLSQFTSTERWSRHHPLIPHALFQVTSPTLQCQLENPANLISTCTTTHLFLTSGTQIMAIPISMSSLRALEAIKLTTIHLPLRSLTLNRPELPIRHTLPPRHLSAHRFLH